MEPDVGVSSPLSACGDTSPSIGTVTPTDTPLARLSDSPTLAPTKTPPPHCHAIAFYLSHAIADPHSYIVTDAHSHTIAYLSILRELEH